MGVAWFFNHGLSKCETIVDYFTLLLLTNYETIENYFTPVSRNFFEIFPKWSEMARNGQISCLNKCDFRLYLNAQVRQTIEQCGQL